MFSGAFSARNELLSGRSPLRRLNRKPTRLGPSWLQFMSRFGAVCALAGPWLGRNLGLVGPGLGADWARFAQQEPTQPDRTWGITHTLNWGPNQTPPNPHPILAMFCGPASTPGVP